MVNTAHPKPECETNVRLIPIYQHEYLFTSTVVVVVVDQHVEFISSSLAHILVINTYKSVSFLIIGEVQHNSLLTQRSK